MHLTGVARRNASSVAFANTSSAMTVALAKNSSLDGGEIEAPLVRLERLAAQRIDPEKFRWRRAISDIVDSRNILTGKQWVRAVAAVARSPLALTSPSARPLLVRAVRHCSFSLDGLDAGDFVSLALALAHARPLELQEKPGATEWPLDDEPEDIGGNEFRMGSLTNDSLSTEDVGEDADVDLYNRFTEAYNGDVIFGDVVSDLFWKQLLPLSFGDLKFQKQDFGAQHADLLFSVACSSHIGRDASLQIPVQTMLFDFVSAIVSNVSFWRFAHVELQKSALFRLVAALGILQERMLLSDEWPSGCRPSDRVSRLLRLDALNEDIDLPSLLMMRIGLRGLGLGTSRMAAALDDKLELTCGVQLPTDALTNALLLLHTTGHFNADEKWASKLICLAANAIDRLRPGERSALRLLLKRLSVILQSNSERQRYPSGSVECIVCSLASRQWFGRRKREETSWMNGRRC